MDGCSIHCTDAFCELTVLPMGQPPKNEALIRNHSFAELHDENEIPQVKYHSKCYQES